jgi:hypothetical protein
MDQTMLQNKTGEALGQGANWQDYVNGQRDFFREQAKLLYPGASNLLDKYSLKQIAEPYFNEATTLLGMNPADMNLSDPKWNAFMRKDGGGMLNKDEWLRVLKTDPQYGWDKTTAARQQFASLGQDLLRAFGR